MIYIPSSLYGDTKKDMPSRAHYTEVVPGRVHIEDTASLQTYIRERMKDFDPGTDSIMVLGDNVAFAAMLNYLTGTKAIEICNIRFTYLDKRKKTLVDFYLPKIQEVTNEEE